jgi:hypothetical protein
MQAGSTQGRTNLSAPLYRSQVTSRRALQRRVSVVERKEFHKAKKLPKNSSCAKLQAFRLSYSLTMTDKFKTERMY